jgi:acyl carrier protein
LTPSGKIDKRALPDADMAGLPDNVYVAPRNELESILVVIWQDLLGVEQVGINDNFFELGGHSLLAIQLISRLEKKINLKIPMKIVFRFSSVAQLAEYIEVLQINDRIEHSDAGYEVLEL